MHYRAWFALAVFGASVFASTPRGVAPENAALYEPREERDGKLVWKCLGTEQVISHSQINDDYCDCADGSDEPGTSACAHGRFYCANKGHLPKYIRSSFVNDGVCDCCDGSDEAEGKTQCPDVCKKENKVYRKEKAQREKVHSAGVKIREQYISSAAKDREFHETALARLRGELAVAQEIEAQLKRALEAAESMNSWFEQQKRSSPLFAQLELRQSTLRAQREALDSVLGELRVVGNMLDRLGPDTTKEDIDNVRDSFRTWLGRTFDQDDEREATLEEKLATLLKTGELTDEELQTLINEDPLSLLDGAPDYSGHDRPSVPHALHHIPSYLPDTLVPLYERGVQWLVNTLVRLEVISPEQRDKPSSGGGVAPAQGVAAARDAYEQSVDALQKLQNDIRYHEMRLQNRAKKYGRFEEFRVLDGTCLERDMGEYTYKFCFGGTTSQISNNDRYTFQLGRFERFDYEDKYSEEDDQHYLTMHYDHGQTCWNGPIRNTLVDLVCSDKNELLHVFEAEKCTYSMRVATPAVCFPEASLQHDGRDAVEHTEL